MLFRVNEILISRQRTVIIYREENNFNFDSEVIFRGNEMIFCRNEIAVFFHTRVP